MRLKGLLKQEDNSEASSGFRGDRGWGTVAILENGWGRASLEQGWGEARKSSL